MGSGGISPLIPDSGSAWRKWEASQSSLFTSLGLVNVFGTATRYGLDGPGIDSQWGRDFPHPSKPAFGPTRPPIQRVLGHSRGLTRRGVALITHLHLAPKLKKEWSEPLLPLCA